jgi:nuclear pore complex protein Nup214
MEGIVKQASDSHYWDLWNHQKLSSEFELKRRHILQMNQVYQLFFFRHRLVRPEVQFFFFCYLPQDLTNQLIELERHFNSLEVNKFGENGGTHVGQRALQSRFRPSRYIVCFYERQVNSSYL